MMIPMKLLLVPTNVIVRKMVTTSFFNKSLTGDSEGFRDSGIAELKVFCWF